MTWTFPKEAVPRRPTKHGRTAYHDSMDDIEGISPKKICVWKCEGTCHDMLDCATVTDDDDTAEQQQPNKSNGRDVPDQCGGSRSFDMSVPILKRPLSSIDTKASE